MIKVKSEIKSGDGLGVEGVSILAKGIQKFQALQDKQSAHINHSATFWWVNGRLAIYEATFVKGIRAAVTWNWFDDYLKSDAKLFVFKLKEPLTEDEIKKLEDVFQKYNAYKYPRIALFREHILRVLTGWWTGGKSDKNFVCHEFRQKCMNEVRGWYPKWYVGNVADEYHSEHITVIPTDIR